MYTPLLIAAVLILPAGWGWLTEILLHRLWPRRAVEKVLAPVTGSQRTDQGGASVDFQI